MALTKQFIEMQEAYESKISELKAKLAESESKAKTYAKEIVFLDKKLENLNKEFELAQEHNEKTVEYWQNECLQLKQQLAEKDGELHQIYSHLGVEAFGEDIHEQALKEIDKKDIEIYLLHTQLNLLRYDEAFKNLADIDEVADE